MALSDADDLDRLRIEELSGTIDDDDVATYESWLTLFGMAEAVALQILSRNLADLERSAAKVRSGTDSVDHSDNPDWLREQIARVVSYLSDPATDTGSLTPAGEDLVARQSAGSTEETVVVRTVAGNTRRG